MSNRYKGGVISATPPTLAAGAGASGTWTLEQQMQATAAGLWPVNGPFYYIEDVFSTWLYEGNGATQTITNGINLSGNGGMVWVRNRSTDTGLSPVHDTVRGNTKRLSTNLTDGSVTLSSGIGVTGFTSTGFSVGTGTAYNAASNNFASWTFRKQAKFFDIVTWTGTGSAQNIPHNLGSVPGCIIVKNLDALTSWCVYHRSLGGTYVTFLNRDFASSTGYEYWANTDPTSSVFTVGNGNGTNGTGYNFVAYVFAHDAGGFGLNSTDNVISCGSFTTDGGGNATVNLGYEPQWILTKQSNATNSWGIYDTLRSWSFTAQKYLLPDTSDSEGTITATNFVPTATGFTTSSPFATSATYIYIAIRKGPMAIPTTGASVFTPAFVDGSTHTATFTPDSAWLFYLPGYNDGTNAYAETFTRLTGKGGLQPPNNRSTNTGRTGAWDSMTAFSGVYGSGAWMFKRAPGYHDVVCYTGTGTPTNFNHNLGVAPELMIVKRRDASSIWAVYAAPLASASTSYFELSTTDAVVTGNTTLWNSTAPTSTVFTIGASTNINTNGSTNVAYLFATLAGVSKVGSYTGTGALQTINCGFSGGARFVLIKRSDSTGDWYIYDSARGISSSSDPYLTLNTYNAEVTGTNYVDTTSVGFQVTAAAPAGINANGGTYIFLAIA